MIYIFDMKPLTLLFALSFSVIARAQSGAPLQHGTVFGTKPNTTSMMKASQVEAFMNTKTRVSTTIEGKVIKVTKPAGGWFELDAGNGKTINAHFKVYNINLPAGLAGHTVIIEGVAQKQFIADDSQHLAGDTVNGKKQHTVNANPKQRLSFEVTGLMVE
jgi:hypothetical protein